MGFDSVKMSLQCGCCFVEGCCIKRSFPLGSLGCYCCDWAGCLREIGLYCYYFDQTYCCWAGFVGCFRIDCFGLKEPLPHYWHCSKVNFFGFVQIC